MQKNLLQKESLSPTEVLSGCQKALGITILKPATTVKKDACDWARRSFSNRQGKAQNTKAVTEAFLGKCLSIQGWAEKNKTFTAEEVTTTTNRALSFSKIATISLDSMEFEPSLTKTLQGQGLFIKSETRLFTTDVNTEKSIEQNSGASIETATQSTVPSGSVQIEETILHHESDIIEKKLPIPPQNIQIVSEEELIQQGGQINLSKNSSGSITMVEDDLSAIALQQENSVVVAIGSNFVAGSQSRDLAFSLPAATSAVADITTELPKNKVAIVSKAPIQFGPPVSHGHRPQITSTVQLNELIVQAPEPQSRSAKTILTMAKSAAQRTGAKSIVIPVSDIEATTNARKDEIISEASNMSKNSGLKVVLVEQQHEEQPKKYSITKGPSGTIINGVNLYKLGIEFLSEENIQIEQLIEDSKIVASKDEIYTIELSVNRMERNTVNAIESEFKKEFGENIGFSVTYNGDVDDDVEF
ncbi:MAG: hypothetical protein AAF320_05700 [Myxococcota bacterium]